MRGIRTDYDIPGRDAEGAWIGTPGCRRYRVHFYDEKWWKNDGKWWTIMKNDEKITKNDKNDEKWKQTKKKNKWWKIMKNDEKLWEKHEKHEKTTKNNEHSPKNKNPLLKKSTFPTNIRYQKVMLILF